MKKNLLALFMGSALFWLCSSGFALMFPLSSPQDEVVGQLQFAVIKSGDDFSHLGMKYDVGYYELIEANPNVDPDHPKQGSVIIIPTRYVLPNVPHKGIIVDIANMRLYYFPADGREVYTFPVGIGKEDWGTPVGELSVMQKIVHPVWIAPDDVLKWRATHGMSAQKVTPAGPDNPLGDFAMRLSNPTYLIHGTNDPLGGIGRRSSAGCIRMFPADIDALFHMTAIGTPVHIIDAPFLAGWKRNQLYLEAHLPLQEDQGKPTGSVQAALDLLKNVAQQQPGVQINWNLAENVAAEQMAIPQVVGRA